MHYTKEWEEAERLVGNILVTHSHSWECPSWEPSDYNILQAIISFAALGVPGCVTALKAERTAIYEQMRKSVTALMEETGKDPVAILCNKRDKNIAEAPFGMVVMKYDGGSCVPLDFMFQGTPVKTWNKLQDDELPIRAVDEVELDYATGRR